MVVRGIRIFGYPDTPNIAASTAEVRNEDLQERNFRIALRAGRVI